METFLQGIPGPMGPPGDPGKEGTPVCTSNSISSPCSVQWFKSNETLRHAEMRKQMSKIFREH